MKKWFEKVLCIFLVFSLLVAFLPSDSITIKNTKVKADNVEQSLEFDVLSQNTEGFFDGVETISPDRVGDAGGECGDNLIWWFVSYSRVLTISGEGDMYNYSVDTDSPWFSYQDIIDTVIIEEGVTSIGNNAFYSCDIKSIVFPDTVTSIGDYAFSGCKLQSIVLPDTVTSIGDYAFSECSELENVVMGNSVVKIGNEAFYNCYNLSKIILSDSLKEIGDRAFYDCYRLGKITIPETVTYIGEYAFSIPDQVIIYGKSGTYAETYANNNMIRFYGTANLSWNIDSSGTFTISGNGNIPDFMIYSDAPWSDDSRGAEKLVIEEGITRIGNNAFDFCMFLEEISFPNSLESIGDGAFRCCASLSQLIIGNSITEIGWGAFSNCSTLQSVTFGDSLLYIGNEAFSSCDSLKEVILPDSLIGVGRGAFSALEKVTVPESLTYIGEGAFGSYDGNLFICGAKNSCAESYAVENDIIFVDISFDTWSIDDSGTLRVWGNGAIADYSHYKVEAPWYFVTQNIKSVIVEKGITAVGESAFSHCYYLENVSFPETLTKIGAMAFWSCSSLNTVLIPESATYIGEYAFSNCYALQSITIPGNVTYIGEYAFSCDYSYYVTINGKKDSYAETYATENNIPFVAIDSSYISWRIEEDGTLIFSGVGMISYDRFDERPWDQGGVFRIKIENGITGIDNYSFEYSYFESISLPDSLNYIGEGAFRGCDNLKSITIPKSVTQIGYCAFEGCPALNSISVEEGNIFYQSKGNCLIDNKTQTLIWGCEYSKIPDDGSVVYIGDYAFAYCIENKYGDITGEYETPIILTRIEIPDSVKHIGNGAFKGVKDIYEITLGNSLQTIGDEAFYDCFRYPSEKTITIPKSVTQIGNKAFHCAVQSEYENYERCYLNLIYGAIDSYASTYASQEGVPFVSNSFNTWEVNSEGVLTIWGEGNMENYFPNSILPPWHSYKGCIKSVVIEEGITSVGDCAFYSYYLENVTLPSTLKSIGTDSFASCAFKSIVIPESVETIAYGAFSGCGALESIVIPSSVTEIGDCVFSSCFSLINVRISNSVKRIGSSMFSMCTSLESVMIPDSVETIGDSAFYTCSSLKAVIIPESVKYIEENVFNDMGGGAIAVTIYGKKDSYAEIYAKQHRIPFVEIDNTGIVWHIENRTLIISGTGDMENYTHKTAPFYGNDNIYSVIIEEGITSIGDYAFSGCSSLQTITIPDSVTKIGRDAINGINYVRIPESVVYIGENNFSAMNIVVVKGSYAEDYAIQNEIFYSYFMPNTFWSFDGEETLTVWGTGDMYDFYYHDVPWQKYNKKIKKIIIEPGLTSIGEGAFWECEAVETVIIPDTVKTIYYDAFSYCKSLKHIVIPTSVTSIEICAFFGCESLEEIVIPESVTKIGNGAFYYCSSLESVVIPDSVQYMGFDVFAYCTSLKEVKIGNSVPSIGNCVFYQCTSLESVIIPKSVTDIAFDAFGLVSDNFAIKGYKNSYAETHAKQYDIPFIQLVEIFWNIDENGTLTISGADDIPNYKEGKAPWYEERKKIKAIVIEEGVTSIGDFSFCSCTAVESVSIPNSVIRIGENAFFECISLESVVIPKTVSKIGFGAFAKCSSLTKLSVADENDSYYVKDNFLIASQSKTLLWGYINSVIPTDGSVVVIGPSAFYGCETLESIIIPECVIAIGENAFSNCNSLEGVIIPEAVTRIEKNSFFNVSDGFCIKGKKGSYAETYALENNIPFIPSGYYPDNDVDAPEDDFTQKATDYVFKVVNCKTGKGLSGVTIYCLDEALITDQNGVAILTYSGEKGVFSFTAEKDGYLKVTSEIDTSKGILLKVVGLEEGESALYPVSCNGEDISVSYANINMHADLTATIKVRGSANATEIIKYELKQNNTVLASSTNGTFTIPNNKFQKGVPVKAFMYTSDGKTKSIVLKINVVAISVTATLLGALREQLTFLKIPQSIELNDRWGLFSNLKLDIKPTERLNISTEATNDEVKIGVNIDIYDKDKSKLNSGLRKWMNEHYRKTPSAHLDFGIGGYVVFKIGNDFGRDVYGEFQIYASYKDGFGKWSFIPLGWIILPIKINVEFSAKGEINITDIEFDKTNQKFIFPNRDLTIDLGVKVEGGPDCFIAAAGVYGSVNAACEFALFPFMLKKINARGEVGAYGRFLWFEGSVAIFSGNFNIYENPNAKSVYESDYEEQKLGLYDLSNYTLADRDYLVDRVGWSADESSNVKGNVTYKTLQESSYTGVEPQTVNANGVIMSAYLDDNGSADRYNYQQLVYTLYDGNTKTWSIPTRVDGNNFVDSAFKLYTDGEEIYIVYCEANKIFTAGDSPLDTDSAEVRNAKFAALLGANEIVVAKYNRETNSFERVGVLTNDDKNDLTPSIVVVDGKIYVSWTKNISSEVFGSCGMTEIYVSVYDGNEWITTKEAEGRNQIGVLDIAIFDGAVSIVAAEDADGDITTNDKNVIVLQNGVIAKIIETAHSPVFAFINGENVLVWCGEDGMCYTSALDGESVNILDYSPLDIRIVNNGNSSAILFTMSDGEDGTELYGIFGIGSMPVRLTEIDGYFDKYGAAFVGASLVVLYCETAVEFLEESFSKTCNICCAYIDLGVDVSLDMVDCDYNEMLQNETTTLTAYLTNNGSENVNGVKITDGNGFEFVYENTILSGESVYVEFEYAFEEDKTVSFTVTATDDINFANNSYSLSAIFSEFKVDAEHIIVADENYISVAINNYGTAEGGVTLKIHSDDCDGEVLYSEDIYLQNGETKSSILEISEDVLKDTDTFYVSLVPMSEDYNGFDNFEYVYIRNINSLILKDDSPSAFEVNNNIVEIGKTGVSLGEFKSKFENHNLSFSRKDGSELSDTDNVGTGMLVFVHSASGNILSQYEVLIKGDVDGNGIIDSTDYLRIKNVFLELSSFDEISMKAADTDESGDVDGTDYMQVKTHFFGKYNIHQ